MPNNRWTKPDPVSLGRLISGLRSNSDSRSSQLVVQTGFPTSLADLVVKNQSRLKKKKKKKIKSEESNTSCDAQPTLLHAVDEIKVETKCTDSVVFSEEKGNGSRIRIGISILVLLVALAIFGKGLVIGITSFAFAVIVFEGFGIRVFEALDLDKYVRRRENIQIGENGVSENCLISPVPLQLDQNSEILVESEDFDVISVVSEENSSKSDELAGEVSKNKNKNKNKKKFFQKLFRKKSQRSNENDEKMNSSDGSGTNGGEAERMMVTKGGLDELNLNDETISDDLSNRVSVVRTEESQTIQELAVEINNSNVDFVDVTQGNLEGKKLRSVWQLFFFFVIVLSVLAGGKLVALLITSFSYMLMKAVQNLHQILER